MNKPLLSYLMAPLLSASGASALDFEPMALSDMVRTADLAVLGRVTAASPRSFSLGGTDLLFGPHDGDAVTILRNKDWSGAEGPGIFRIGQSMIVFAARTGESVGAGKPLWRVIGIENEAVLPIDDDEALYTGAMNGLEVRTYDLDGVTLSAHAFDIAEFAKAVRAYRECFDPMGGKPLSASDQMRCSPSEFEALRSETEVGRFLTVSSTQQGGTSEPK
jgi:hypothetical protein